MKNSGRPATNSMTMYGNRNEAEDTFTHTDRLIAKTFRAVGPSYDFNDDSVGGFNVVRAILLEILWNLQTYRQT